MKNVELLNYRNNLEKLNKKKDLPGAIGFAILRNKHILDSNLAPYNEMRNELIKKYGTKSDKGYEIKPDSPNVSKFITEMSTIGDQDIGNVEFQKIKEKDIASLSFSLDELEALLFMIEE